MIGDESEGGDCDEVICAGWDEPGGQWTEWGWRNEVLSSSYFLFGAMDLHSGWLPSRQLSRTSKHYVLSGIVRVIEKSFWLWHGTGHVKWSNHFIHLHSRHYYHHEYHVTRGLIYRPTRERSDVGGLEVGWRWTRVATTQRPMYLSVLSGGWTERRTGWLPHSQCTVIM